MSFLLTLFRRISRAWAASIARIRIARFRAFSVHGDTALIARLTRRRWPTLAQWKYFVRFLSRTERLILSGALCFLVLSGALVLTRAYLTMTVRVPARGGTYTEALAGYPRFLNPVLAQTDVDADLTRLLFSGLFKRSATLELVPDLVATHVISDDKKTYTFTLREGLVFDDGEPLTARDVAFTIEAIQDPDWRSPLAPLLRGVAVNAIDERTIALTLRQPFAPFLDNLTFGILPEHIWGDVDPTHAAFADENIRSIGSGAFRVASLTKQEDIITTMTLTRNERYHGIHPYLDRLVFTFMPDVESTIAARTNKQVDGIGVVPASMVATLERDKRSALYALRTPRYITLLNRSAPTAIVNDRGTREALFLAVDRPRIFRDILGVGGELAVSLIPKGALGYDPAVTPLPYDPNAAHDALKTAGWKELAREGYTALWEKQERERRTHATTETATSTPPTETPTPLLPEPRLASYWERNGRILTLTVTIPDTPEFTGIATIIREGWEALGIPVEVIAVPPHRFAKDVIQPRAYTMLLTTILVGADPDPYPFWHSSQSEPPGLNLANFANPEVDTLLDEARRATSVEDRATRYKKFQEIFRRELPALVLANQHAVYAVDRAIQGITADRILIPADRFATISQWYVKTRRIWKP